MSQTISSTPFTISIFWLSNLIHIYPLSTSSCPLLHLQPFSPPWFSFSPWPLNPLSSSCIFDDWSDWTDVKLYRMGHTSQFHLFKSFMIIRNHNDHYPHQHDHQRSGNPIPWPVMVRMSPALTIARQPLSLIIIIVGIVATIEREFWRLNIDDDRGGRCWSKQVRCPPFHPPMFYKCNQIAMCTSVLNCTQWHEDSSLKSNG